MSFLYHQASFHSHCDWNPEWWREFTGGETGRGLTEKLFWWVRCRHVALLCLLIPLPFTDINRHLEEISVGSVLHFFCCRLNFAQILSAQRYEFPVVACFLFFFVASVVWQRWQYSNASKIIHFLKNHFVCPVLIVSLYSMLTGWDNIRI